MKKALSLILAAALASVGFAAMGTIVSADASGFDYDANGSIDSAEEYVDFVKKINSGAYNDGEHRNFKVNVDLDLSAYPAEDVVIKELYKEQVIEFDGHTVSGINRQVTLAQDGNAGLIADKAGNYAEIHNVKIKDCKLSVTMESDAWGKVGGVLGFSDRSYVNSAEFENVTIELNGSGTVGVLYGHKQWNDWRGPDASVSLKNVVINAPDASVGLIIGRQGDVDGDSTTIKKLEISDTTITASNEVKADTYVGTGELPISVAEGTVVSVTFVDNATGYVAPGAGGNESKPDPTPTPDPDPKPTPDPAPTGSASVVIAAVAVAALAGVAVAARKREQN